MLQIIRKATAQYFAFNNPGVQYDLQRHTALYKDSVENKISSFGELPNGWDFGEGQASPSQVISLANRIYRLGKSIGLKGDAFPGIDGGISLAFYSRDHTLEIRIAEDLSIELAYEIGIGANYEIHDIVEHANQRQLTESLLKLSSHSFKTWNSSAHSTYSVMTPTENALPVTVFESTAMGFQLSNIVVH